MPVKSLNVGLIGVRSTEIEALVPTLQAQTRFSIAAIYDSCYQSARDLAAPLKAKPAASLVQMLDMSELHGVIVLETDWQKTQPLFMSCCHQIPTLFRPATSLNDPFVSDQLLNLSNQWRTMLMPAYSHRWSPAVLRMQELRATSLGNVDAITFRIPTFEPNLLLESLDWCWNLIQSSPTQVQSTATDSITIEFRRVQSSQDAPVTVTLEHAPAQDAQASITCQRGEFTFIDDKHLQWKSETEQKDEELCQERDSLVVMLDLFGRRLSGGLVPVPTIQDVVRNQKVLQKIHESRETGSAIQI